MKFEYSPGLFGYGPKGADGSAGIVGFSIYYTDYDPIDNMALITNAITNNYVMLSSVDPNTPLPSDRVYHDGELFISKSGDLFKIDSAETKKYVDLGIKINRSRFFETVTPDYSDQGHQRYYNIISTTPKYIFDNVNSVNDDYTLSPEKIYNIYPKNFTRIEYSNIADGSYNAFTLYSSAESNTENNYALALVRDISTNTFRIGNLNRDSSIIDTTLMFDVKLLRKNTTPFSLNTQSGEIISNSEINANSLFTGIFNGNPATFTATNPASLSLKISWILLDFIDDVNVEGNLVVYKKITPSTPSDSFNPMIFHGLEIDGDITITNLPAGTYCYHMNFVKNGWSRDSSIKEKSVT